MMVSLTGLTREKLVDPLSWATKKLVRQKYHMIGTHSAVKKCLWVHNALTQQRFCYKCKFYGIESHRCIQFSPSVLWCWNACLHCWRIRPQDMGLSYKDLTRLPYVDDPEFLVDQAIVEHRRTVSGYKDRAPKDMWEEAINPKHVAISLTGEPLLYPRFGELLEEFHKRGITTFVVTRGVRPEVIASLDEEPTQLYVSLEAWNKKMYEYFNRPLTVKAWEKTVETLSLFPSLSSPTVVRITLVKGFNNSFNDVRGFAELLRDKEPTYIEVKAYMYVGGSTNRLSHENMPTLREVYNFAKSLADELGYNLASYSAPSRVVLLSKFSKPVIRYGKGCPRGWKTEELGDEFSGEYGASPEDVL